MGVGRLAGKRGRPTSYSDEAAEEILQRLRDGESLTTICKSDYLPCRDSVARWARGEAGAPASFSGDYAQARSDQAEVFFDEVVDIADGAHEAADALGEEAAEKAPEGRERDAYRRVYNEEINARRLRIDSRKWVLARMDRGKYGDASKVQVGGDPDSPPVASVTTAVEVDTDQLSPEEQEQLRKLAQKAMQRGEG